MKTNYLILLLLLITSGAMAQPNYTLSGYVKDSRNGEELIGVTVLITEKNTGAITNAYGFYSITLPSGDYTVSFSYLGYATSDHSIQLTQNLTLNTELKESVIQMDELVITDKPIDENVTGLKMSSNELNIQQIKKMPALFGEPDIIKTIQMLPGVISAGEGTSSFFVRGGSADQNLILIDEAPIYDPSHLFGLFSVFNSDVIKDAELYKGGIPSRFGGRLASILDVRTKDGNNKKLSGAGGIGTLAGRFMLEGPIRKDKSSFIISGRRSYADLFLKAAGKDNLVHFYDVNAKVNWKHSNKNRFYTAIYLGRDVFNFGDDFGFDWGNATATFRWNHLFNERLFSNTSVIASNFDYGLKATDNAEGFDWTSDLKEFTIKQDLSYFPNLNHELSFGYHVTYRAFSPGLIEPTSPSSIFKKTELQKMYALDHAFYLGDEQRVSNRLSLKYGMRLSIFQNVGKEDVYTYSNSEDNVNIERVDTLQFGTLENIKTYVRLEPRFAARYLLGSTSSIKFSYNRMAQNTHLIASGTVPLPFNTWSPSSTYLKPQLSDQIAIGYFKNLKNNTYEISIESYYKDMNNVTDFADNADIFFNQDLATEFRQGKSWSYGVELLAQKKEGLLTGFVSYTWSKTERKITGVNKGETFIANYDRRHNFNAVATYDYNAKWSFGANFTYSTGRPLTVPGGRYEFGDGYNVDYITGKNQYRLPAIHRMDLSATLTPKPKENRKWQGNWVFSIYNAYSRKNPFTVFTRTKKDDDGEVVGNGAEKEARLVYLFPILPSVTYNIKF